ncbi:ankyrin repeat domain-containing protein [Agarivorans aestuarii]|uniref:ankyrin repeat domain-containing protein n=1 Tax=Agarivorans aestuarii TaxID=1563703 RepID=UPI001C7F8906|nr:ankyrin repeat domain-containing protein [Agarivorans aestuarii]
MKYIIAFLLFSLSLKAFPEDMSLEEIGPGEYIIHYWYGLPIVVYKRTPDQIEKLIAKNANGNPYKLFLASKQYAFSNSSKKASVLYHSTKYLDQRPLRSVREDILVMLGVGSGFGCALNFKEKDSEFLDGCSDASYGLDGRIINKSDREAYDIFIPPHQIKNNHLILGSGDISKDQVIDFSPQIQKMKVSKGEKLLLALQWNKQKYALKLINRETVKTRTRTNATPLHIASGRSDIIIIRSMIESGSDVNALTNEGWSPLHFAILTEQHQNAAYLISQGAKTNAFCVNTTCAESALEFLVSRYPDMSMSKAKETIDSLHNKALTSKSR